MRRLSNFGVLGYGYDVIDMQPKAPIAAFTYQGSGQTIEWDGEDIVIPDQVIFSETPNGTEITANFSNKISTARELQSNMKVEVGLEVTDPETDLTFKGDAKFANELFEQTDQQFSLELYEAAYVFVFLQLSNIRLSAALLPEVADAAAACGENPDLIAAFYDTFGTHVVTRADVGGKMHIRTTLRLDAQSSRTISEQKLDVKGQVSMENDDYVKGGLDFNHRDEKTEKIYRSVSKKDISLIGGDITAKDADAWRTTLKHSKIPTQDLAFPFRYAMTHGAVGSLGEVKNQNLGLINLKYTAIYEVLNLGAAQKAAFANALEEHLRGKNPFSDEPQRLEPDMADYTALDAGEKVTFEMRGWLATYETYAGLYAKPGARAIVRCKSDAEPGGWTEKTVYAGEKIQLRDKTAYFSRYMDVEFIKGFDDDEAVVYAQNTLVSW